VVSRSRKETWLAVAVAAVAVAVVVVLGLYGFMIATAPLHTVLGDVPSVTRTDPPQQWRDAVQRGREIVRAALPEQNLPGLSVAVAVRDDLVWAEGFGWADLEHRVPVAPETRLRIGTASQALTSAAVGLLLEKKRLTLDDEIQRHVPEFPDKESPITLRQLMGHVAGLRTDSGDEGPLFSQRCERPVDSLRFFADRSLLFEPGTEYRRSSYGWILVSAAVEAAAGEPFNTFMQKQVFEPAGMNDTLADSATEPIPNRATFYFPRFGADPRYGLHVMRPLDYSCYAGASVFLSTPSDLVRFAIALGSGRLLQPATVDLLQTSQHLASGQETGYGLGWELKSAELRGKTSRVIGHDGDSLGGRVASLLTFPEHRIVVSVISNISYADTYSLAVRLAEAFANDASSGRR
jgi:CubicO group peptidase (beta-lactamase class C family)